MKIFGYFDREEQTEPTFDPGLEVICPICMFKLTPPVVTTSLLVDRGARSYFYRMHKACASDKESVAIIESSLVDSIVGSHAKNN